MRRKELDYIEVKSKSNIAMPGIPLFFGILLLALVVEFGIWFFVALFVGSLMYSFMLIQSPKVDIQPKKVKRKTRTKDKDDEIPKLDKEIIPVEFHPEETNKKFKKGKDISFIEFDNI